MRVAIAMTASLCAASSRAQSVQDFINDHHALEAAAQQCNAEVNQHFQQMRWAISRGMQPSLMPMCQYNAPRIIARMAYDETQVKRLQGISTTYCDTGVCQTPPYTPQPGWRQGPADNSGMEHIVNGEEVTRSGNVMPIGPNGDHHFDCGPGGATLHHKASIPIPTSVANANDCAHRKKNPLAIVIRPRNGRPRSHTRPEPRIRRQRARTRWYRNTSSAALSPRRSARLTRVVR